MEIRAALRDLTSPMRQWKIWFLVAHQDIQLRYRRSILGPIWISLALASLILGLSIIYSDVFDVNFGGYILYIGCGFLAWFFIAGMVNDGAGAVIEAEGQLRSIPLRIPVLIAKVVYRHLIVFVHNLVVVGGMLLIFNFQPSWVMLLGIPALLLYLVNGFLLGNVLAPLCTRFRDLPQLLASIMQIMFFLTPIIWMPSQFSSRPFLVHGNVLYHMVHILRGPLLGEAPGWESWTVALGTTLVLAVLAIITLAISRRRIYLWL